MNAEPSGQRGAVSLAAVSLARQSEARDDQDESLSLAFQFRRAREEAARFGDEIVAEFADLDVPGDGDSRSKRTGLSAMMAYLRQHPEVRRVYIYNVSRLARDAAYTLELVRELRNLRPPVELRSASENIEDPTILTIMASFAERERIQLSNNVAYAVRESAQRGRMTQPPPYGYRRVDGEVVPHASEARVVREAFHRYARGETTSEIIAWLHAEGIPTAQGKSNWRFSTLVRMLRNRAYIGEIHISETRDPVGRVRPALIARGNHERLVDRETWDVVQRRLDRKAPVRRPTTYPAPWLAGAVRCAACGDRLYVELVRSKPERVQPYWVVRCAGHRKARDLDRDGRCPGQPVGILRPIDAAARDRLAADLAHLIDPETARRRAIQHAGEAAHARAAELRAILADIDDRLARAYLAYEAGDISLELHRQRKLALERQREQALAELAEAPVIPETELLVTARGTLVQLADAIAGAPDDALREVITELGAVAMVDVRTKSVCWEYAEPYRWLIAPRAP